MTERQDKHPKRCHRIYLAGSWKNQQEIFLIRDILKTQGHEVDCFASEENGRISFNWSKLPDIQDKLPKMDAKDMLEVPRVQEAFREDKKWIDWCDLCLLTLPSGKSSHLEAGYAKGQGKTVVIFGDLKKGDFDVMYGFADAIFRCDELDKMVDFVNSNDSSTILTAEKDDVHWITGQELREIYADDLSLDKYDEIRKRPAAKVENVPLCIHNGQIDCCQTPNAEANKIAEKGNPVPSSTELIAMAKQEWHNREERRGIHDEVPWCSGFFGGWVAGFLSDDKPNWRKEQIETLRRG